MAFADSAYTLDRTRIELVREREIEVQNGLEASF